MNVSKRKWAWAPLDEESYGIYLWGTAYDADPLFTVPTAELAKSITAEHNTTIDERLARYAVEIIVYDRREDKSRVVEFNTDNEHFEIAQDYEEGSLTFTTLGVFHKATLSEEG